MDLGGKVTHLSAHVVTWLRTLEPRLQFRLGGDWKLAVPQPDITET